MSLVSAAPLSACSGLIAVELRHHDVEDHEVGMMLVGLLDRLFPVMGEQDVVALELEVDLQQAEDHRVVVADQDLLLAGCHGVDGNCSHSPLGVPCRRALERPIQRTRRLELSRCPRSSGDRALASGARCAGSNPAGGTYFASSGDRDIQSRPPERGAQVRILPGALTSQAQGIETFSPGLRSEVRRFESCRGHQPVGNACHRW